MGLEDELNDLVERAYAAALDDRLWPDWSWRVTELLGGACCGLYVLDRSGQLASFTVLHKDMKAVERYIDEQISRYDPQIPFVTALAGPRLFLDTDHVDPDDPNTAEYLSWQGSIGKIRHYMTTSTRIDEGRYFAGISIHRAVTDGPTPSEPRRMMTRLFPDISRALALGFAHREKLTESYWDGLLSERETPSALLDDSGRILRSTEAMEAILAAGDGLTGRRGRLTCDSDDPGGLTRVIHDAVVGTPPRAGVRRIARPSGKPGYIATVYPLVRNLGFPTAIEARALVTVVDPARPRAASASVWAEAFGLTARETEMATLLMAGHSVDSASATLSISAATGRVHLRNLFGKTSTSRQPDLVRLLSRIG